MLNAECYLQLRNLVWATSKHDFYLVSNYSVMHWSSLHQNLTEVLDFSGNIVPTEVLNFIWTFFFLFCLLYFSCEYIFMFCIFHFSYLDIFSCSLHRYLTHVLLFYFTDVSFIHVEISRDIVGRLYRNTAEHTSCERSFSGGRWLPWRTYLQGKQIHWNLWIISLK